MKTTRTHQRAADQVNVSISMSVELLKKIEAAAKAENRNRSNWIQHHVPKLLKNTSGGEAPARYAPADVPAAPSNTAAKKTA